MSRGGPCFACSSWRCGSDSRSRSHKIFLEPRDVTGKQPIVVGTHRPLGAGHPAATRGGSPPGASDTLDACAPPGNSSATRGSSIVGTAHSLQGGLASGAALRGRGVRGGCPRCHGDKAPPRGLGRNKAAKSGYVPRLRPNHTPRTLKCFRASPWLQPLHCPACGLTAVLRVRSLQQVVCGGADSANIVLSGRRAACWPPGSQKIGAVGDWGKE